MQPFGLSSMAMGFSIAAAMAIRGTKRESLTPAGSVAALVVGFVSMSCGLRGFLLLLFYAVATKATKHKNDLKSRLDSCAAESSRRGPNQVLACSAVAVACQLGHVVWCGEERSIDFGEDSLASSFACAVIAHYAICLADTLASEMGILAERHDPVLIISGRKVPPGTNGGVTLSGTAYSALGGGIIGAGAVILDVISGLRTRPLACVAFGTACGILGSFVDSVLGATLQVTYFDKEKKQVCMPSHDGSVPPGAVHVSGMNILTNAQVNLVSILLVSALGTLIGDVFFR